MKFRHVRWTRGSLLPACLLLAAALCSVLSLIGTVVGREPWLSILAVTDEQNIPTWYSIFVMLIAAAMAFLAGLVGGAAQHHGVRVRWWLLASLLTAMSVDEEASLHERLGEWGASLVQARGLLHFAWVVPGVAIAAIGVVMIAQLTRRLPRPVGAELLAGFGIFLFAALGLEMLGGLVLDSVGDGWTYVIVSTFEEFLEMAGIIVAIHAITRMLTVHITAGATLAVRYASTSTNRDHRALHHTEPPVYRRHEHARTSGHAA